ncbi:23141_t:CDS:2 [Gigaspora margarita]|uniref:23141_t:CDS:1 n=1 Tax=Gigaspora margarita TaxID=4874 RepID=A0ABN7U9W1_GIGMA|nr:23141_t:CDS:2 [Gigaspora margarita]
MLLSKILIILLAFNLAVYSIVLPNYVHKLEPKLEQKSENKSENKSEERELEKRNPFALTLFVPVPLL